MVEAHLAKIDVERSFFAASESEIPVVNGVLGNVVSQLLFGAGHGLSLAGRLKLAW